MAGGRLADLDAVTLDAHGTLVELDDPVGRLRAALAAHGVDLDEPRVRAAFEAEVDHYLPRAVEGRDAASLAALQLDCARVFLEAAGADLDPAAFVEPFLAALVFRPLPGAREAVAGLVARGLTLAVVSNWDVGLPEHLGRAGYGDRFAAIVTSAEAGAEKPDPRLWTLALERLGVEPDRALHVGDRDVDADGARAAGLHAAAEPLEAGLGAWR